MATGDGGAISVIAVLVLSNFLGAFIKGITGFGSAILNLCVWVVATCAGINSGTLQQAVLTECIASMVLALPLLFMTKAHATADWALVFSLSLFGAVGAPVGAALLTHLPARQVELAIGCLMLLVIFLNCTRKATNTQQEPAQQAAASAAAECAVTNEPSHSQLGSSQEVELLLLAADAPIHTKDDLSTEATLIVHTDADDVSTAHDSPVQRTHSGSSSSSRSSFAADAQCVLLISCQEPLQETADADGEHASLLQSVGCVKQPPSDGYHTACTDAEAGTSHVHAKRGVRERWQTWWVSVTQPNSLAAFKRMLLMGSVAGSCGGVMAGLTGIGGPPVMLMFEQLQVPKDVVRGTNAVCNVLQPRIFAYIAMGVVVRSDFALYAAVSVAAVAGMMLGCLAAARTDQVMFSRMLTFLMVLCCVLMFASAAGITGHSST